MMLPNTWTRYYNIVVADSHDEQSLRYQDIKLFIRLSISPSISMDGTFLPMISIPSLSLSIYISSTLFLCSYIHFQRLGNDDNQGFTDLILLTKTVLCEPTDFKRFLYQYFCC